MKNDYLNGLSPKVKIEVVSLVNDFYSIEKQHTVVVMPFFGLLHNQGNESKPLLNYADINVLDLMQRQFRDVIVYPGENGYLSSYGQSLKSVEHLAHEQNVLSRIVNRTTNFDKLSDRHREILYLYEKAIADFDVMKEKYPLPYKTAFDIRTPEDLISFVNQLNREIKEVNINNKICLVCPISYLIDHSSDIYNAIAETINSIGGTLYFAQNQSDMYLNRNDFQILFNDQYDEKIIQSIQDFSNTYNNDITEIAKKKLHLYSIVNSIQNGDYGSTENEILGNLNLIDVEMLYRECSSNKMEEQLS